MNSGYFYCPYIYLDDGQVTTIADPIPPEGLSEEEIDRIASENGVEFHNHPREKPTSDVKAGF